MENYDFLNGQTLYEVVANAATKRPNATAIYYKGKKISYGKFLKRINRMADILVNTLHLKKGDTIMISQPNIPDTLVLFYAANKVGIIADMVHPFTPYNQLVSIYRKTNSKKAFLFEQRVAKEVDRYREFSDNIIVTRIEDDLPFLFKVFYHVFMNGKIRKKLGKWTKFNGFLHLKNIKPTGLNTDTVKEENKCTVLLHSGSTTGDPKTICLKNDNFNYICARGDWFYCCSREELRDTGMLSILPSFHGFGLCMTMHVCFANDFVCLLMPKFTVKDVVKYMKKTNIVNCIIGVPNIFEKLCDYKPFVNSKYLKNIKICFCGGDSLPIPLQQRFNEIIKNGSGRAEVFQGYGLTEAVAANCVNNYNHSCPGSLGYPIPGVEFAILDEKDNVLGPNKLGEIALKSRATMIEYFNDPEATKNALRNGWLHTGDLGTMNEDGFIFFKQRAKRVIKVSGVGVFPGEIESLVALMRGVSGACAIRIPDPVLINAVKLFVVAEYVDEEGMRHEILDTCRKYLIKWAVPKEIEFIDELPLTKLGKVDFMALQKMEDQRRKIK